MNKKLLRKKLALMLATLKKKRKYYCEVEYLESNNGYQYINTGYTGNSTTRVIIGASSSLTSGNIPLFGARDTNGYYNSFSIWENTSSTGMRFDYTDTTPNVISSKTWLTTGINIIEKNGRYNYVNGVQVNSNTEKTFSCNNPFYLMAIDTSGIAVNGFVGSVSFCKIYDNGTLVRDFIPVLDWNMTPCMYDKVTEQLFYNQGTGTFIAGREIHYVDYLESTGTQYINTGWIPNANGIVELKGQYTEVGSSSYSGAYYLFAQHGGTNARFNIGQFSKTQTLFCFDITSINYQTSISLDTDEHIFRINASTKTLSIDDTVFTPSANNFGSTTYPSYLFCRDVGGVADAFSKARVYYCKIHDNGTLVRDYLPAIDENGVGFMFDRVSHTIYDNAGTGVFNYPAREVEYLTSDGGPYIDTGIQPTDDYGYKIKNTYTRGGGEQCAIGCMDNGNRFVGIYTSGAENQLSGAWGSFVGFLPAYSWNTGDILDVEVNYKNSRKMIVGGTELKDISDVHISGTISNTLYLFARHYGGTITKMQGNVYGVEITNGQNIVADFIPAFKDGQIGMYDKVSGVLKTNDGTGSFTTGRILEKEYE